MKARIVMSILIAGLTTGLVFAGGQSEEPQGSEGPQTITVWSGQEDAGEQAIVRLFNETHEDYQVEWEVVPYRDYATKVIAASRAGELPDVLLLQPRMPATYGRLGYLEPVSGLVDEMGGTETFSPQDLRYNTLDGEIWGVPFYSFPHVLFYRKDLLQSAGITSAPRNWNEFRAAAQALTTGDRVGYVGFLADPSVGHLIHQWMGSRGADTFGPELELTIEAPETIETLDFLYGLHRDGIMNDNVVAANMDDARLAYVNDNAAMVTTSTTFIVNLANSPVLENTGVAPLPKNGGHANYYAFRSIGIARGARNPEGAEYFVRWMNRPEVQDEFFANGRIGSIPANRAYIEGGTYWELERIRPVRALLEAGIEVNLSGGWFPGMDHQINEYIALFDTQNVYQNMLIRMIVEGAEAQEAAALAAEQMAEIMDR